MKQYRRKPQVVQAEVYAPGLEDGCEFYELSGKYLCYMTKAEMNEKGYPKASRLPIIETAHGRVRVEEGDYILVDENGQRSVCKPSLFAEMYEAITVL